ncbi:MAG TPA: TIGR01244 family phosphatase [Xanthomonadaceae bacterium]|jgi:sulfide:quinone oxidoreductase|nr:TIGR01244 family phosphatase [Xanthomonadaceae bacterium]
MLHTKIDARLSVAAQISVSDVADFAAAGFTLLINNRPDGEVEGQPEAAVIAAEARRCGLEFVDLPVVGGAISEADVDAFDAALARAPGPVLAYCRSGTRSTMLWALAEVRRRPVDAVLADCQRAGYDLDALRPRLQALAGRAPPSTAG